MDLSRRKFLGMLGLAPAIPLIAPKKTYAFFGNIFKPKPKLVYAVTDFGFDYQRISLPIPLIFDAAPTVEDLFKFYRPAALCTPGGVHSYWMQCVTADGTDHHELLTIKGPIIQKGKVIVS